ncbi:MAG TPA: NDP-sugar synthase [Herpetosiphonaceae bacterium]
MMQAVILVGGQGTRLRPLTLTTPKPLVPLANRPVIEHIVRWLEGYAVSEIILATQYRAQAFERWLRRWKGVKVRAVEEPEPRGTAGAVAHVAGALHGTTIVVNGDNLMSLDLDAMLAFHRSAGASATISIDAVADPTGRGVVVAHGSGRVEEFQEKPAPGTARANTVNTGVYLLEPEALAAIPPDRFCNFEHDVFPQLIASGAPVYAFQSEHTWIDTGTPGGYLRAQAAVLRGAASAPLGELIGGVWRDDNVTIDGAASVEESAVGFGTIIASQAAIRLSSIGREAHILAGTQITGSAIWDGCQVEVGAVVDASIVGYNCYIGAGAQIAGSVIGDNCIIRAGAVLASGTIVQPGTTCP